MSSDTRYPSRHGIALKKQHGQCFLKDEMVIHNMIAEVSLDDTKTVVEIGCGEGILTEAILATPCKSVHVFEIDEDWYSYVKEEYGDDKRLNIFHENILDVRFETRMEEHAPLVILANLPYHITFPIFYMFHRSRHLISEGVVMIQEEVAQKLVKVFGRTYGYSSLFFQHYFEMRLLDKVPPTAFYPAPKVFSRLLYFKPKKDIPEIPEEERFWKFIKGCFKFPRRTLRNNLANSIYDEKLLSEDLLKLRGQQLAMTDLLEIWNLLRLQETEQ
jgi:16S rRNA (adenine1518-N6/adenine1519-N6)-dimethyltransferase